LIGVDVFFTSFSPIAKAVLGNASSIRFHLVARGQLKMSPEGQHQIYSMDFGTNSKIHLLESIV
jgi:hypothetical protein